MSRRAVTVVLGLLPFIGGCSGGLIGDILPHAIGGLPGDAPPRPGRPGHEEWLQKVYGTKSRDRARRLQSSPLRNQAD